MTDNGGAKTPEAASTIQEGSAAIAPPPIQEAPAEPARSYCANVHPGRESPLDEELGATLAKLEANLGLPVWVIAQAHRERPFIELEHDMFNELYAVRRDLPEDKPVALVVHSLGGSARAAYLIARLLQRRCGFHAIVPRHAMSAATLLVLGSDRVLMGRDAILGPLDAQLWDPESETHASVLNEVQSLERLRAYALDSIDETMFLLIHQTQKKIDSLLPHVLKFVADMNRPLLEKIDVVHYTERSRMLKEAEQYALRLLRRRWPDPQQDVPDWRARNLVSSLVESYTEHGFPIDTEELRTLGLPVDEPTDEQAVLLEDLWSLLEGNTIIGRVEEVVTDAGSDAAVASDR